MGLSLCELIFRVPTCVVGYIVTDWLLITDVCKLDAGCANVHLRQHLLSLYSSGEVVYESIPQPIEFVATMPHLLLWLKQRSLPMSTMEVTPELDLDLLDSYLQLLAIKLKVLSVVNLTGGTDDIVHILESKDLLHMLTIRCTSSNVGCAFNKLLRLAAHLQEIRLNWCNSVDADLFWNTSLPQVRTATFSSSHVDTRFVQSFAMACRNVVFLNLSNCGDVNDEAVWSVAHNCPLLKLISLAELNITDGAIIQLSTCCPDLILVDIRACILLTNESIFSIAQHCRNLQRLHVSSNTNFTDAALTALTVHGASALKALDVVDCSEITSLGIIHVIDHYPNLITLFLGGVENYQESELPLILAKCCRIEKLCLEFRTLPEGVLECIALHCRCIAELSLFHVEQGITEEGLLALATQCTQLEVLVLPPKCSVLTSFAEQLWKMLRPGLQIFTGEEDELGFDMEAQMDWHSQHYHE